MTPVVDHKKIAKATVTVEGTPALSQTITVDPDTASASISAAKILPNAAPPPFVTIAPYAPYPKVARLTTPDTTLKACSSPVR